MWLRDYLYLHHENTSGSGTAIKSSVTILITTATITLDLIESLDVDMSNKPSWTSSYAGHTFSEWEPWVLNLSTTEALSPPPPKKINSSVGIWIGFLIIMLDLLEIWRLRRYILLWFLHGFRRSPGEEVLLNGICLLTPSKDVAGFKRSIFGPESRVQNKSRLTTV